MKLHAPLEQEPVVHTFPQDPQLLLSVLRFTQTVPPLLPVQDVIPFPQNGVMQVPPEQDCPEGQAFPQEPQFAGSVCRLTQEEPQGS
jgi:hypothetical protein